MRGFFFGRILDRPTRRGDSLTRRLRIPVTAEPRDAGLSRSFRVGLDSRALSKIQKGVMRTTYRGVPFLKSPFDIALYLQLINDLRPRTVVEIGARAGGSALWFADMLRGHELDGRVLSVDIDPRPEIRDDRVTFLQGDANDLGASELPTLLREARRPWLVVEDSAHTEAACTGVLSFFDDWLEVGDYIVVEDGVLDFLPERTYRQYGNGPNRAVAKWMTGNSHRYAVDSRICDWYGHNVTWSPNGWLRRV